MGQADVNFPWFYVWLCVAAAALVLVDRLFLRRLAAMWRRVRGSGGPSLHDVKVRHARYRLACAWACLILSILSLLLVMTAWPCSFYCSNELALSAPGRVRLLAIHGGRIIWYSGEAMTVGWGIDWLIIDGDSLAHISHREWLGFGYGALPSGTGPPGHWFVKVPLWLMLLPNGAAVAAAYAMVRRERRKTPRALGYVPVIQGVHEPVRSGG